MSRLPRKLPIFGRRFRAYFSARIGKPRGRKGCRMWLGTVGKMGYGHAIYKDKTYLAHRVARFLATGENIEGANGYVCHTCDNRACCEPQHLFAGSTQMNTRDRDSKKRMARGERQHLAVLTASRVREIRRRAARGESPVQLAKQFGVHNSTIHRVIDRVTWKHI